MVSILNCGDKFPKEETSNCINRAYIRLSSLHALMKSNNSGSILKDSDFYMCHYHRGPTEFLMNESGIKLKV